jgi:chaperone BCS1
MDSIFFNDKDEIMKIILRFIKEKEFYKAVGKPYQIGFLLSGEPGCGKSSFIRALSNELNRSIKELKFNVIKDLYDLNKVMKCAEYKNIKMDCDKTIIVAEDVDACTDILYEREKLNTNSSGLNNPELMSAIKNYNSDNTDNIDNSNNIYTIDNTDTNNKLVEILKEFDKNNSKNKAKNNKDEDKPTLSDILNITDGINSNDGRIMIFTTNHPEKLDKALIRPGRLDYHIVFGKMRKNVLYDMITNWYKKYDELVIFNKYDKADKADKANTEEESCYDKFISIWNEKNNEFIDEKLKPCDVACILQKYGEDVNSAINALIEKQTA